MSKDTTAWLANIDKLKADVAAGVINPADAIAKLQEGEDIITGIIDTNTINISNAQSAVLQANNNITLSQQQIASLQTANTELAAINAMYTSLIAYFNGEVS